MLNHYPYFEDHKNAKVIQLYGWLSYDICLIGLFVYNWMVLQVQTFAQVTDTAEKFILFCCTTVFAGYRIYILHIDAQKKKIELNNMREESKEKRKRV